MSAVEPISRSETPIQLSAVYNRLLQDAKVMIYVSRIDRADTVSSDGSLAGLLPASAGDTGLTAYYRQLTRLFSEHSVDGPVAYFGQLAIDSTAPDDPSVRDLWTKVFLANLAVASYEDAYSVLSSCPHLDL